MSKDKSNKLLLFSGACSCCSLYLLLRYAPQKDAAAIRARASVSI